MLMLTVLCANKYNSCVQPCWENKQTLETITEIVMVSTTNMITNISNHQVLTIKTIKQNKKGFL